MRAIILAAGIGKRLLPLTRDIHKCLVEVGGKPIIKHQLDTLKYYGISDVIIVGGYRIDQIKDYLKNTVTYVFNPIYKETNSVYSLWLAKEFMGGDDVLVFNADLMVDPSIIKELIERKSDLCTVVDMGKWNPTGYKVVIGDHKVIDMGMDLKKEETSGEYAGMTKITKSKLKAVVEMLGRYISEKRVNDWYEAAFVSMLKEGHAMDYVGTNGRWWVEIDYKEELEKTREYFDRIRN